MAKKQKGANKVNKKNVSKKRAVKKSLSTAHIKKSNEPIKDMSDVFVDAQGLYKSAPNIYYAPPKKELESIKQGDIVHVKYHGDSFTVLISSVSANKVSGVVNIDPSYSMIHGIGLGAKVKFHKKNIFKISNNAS